MMSYVMSRETMFMYDPSKNLVALYDVIYNEQGNYVCVRPL